MTRVLIVENETPTAFQFKLSLGDEKLPTYSIAAKQSLELVIPASLIKVVFFDSVLGHVHVTHQVEKKTLLGKKTQKKKDNLESVHEVEVDLDVIKVKILKLSIDAASQLTA